MTTTTPTDAELIPWIRRIQNCGGIGAPGREDYIDVFRALLAEHGNPAPAPAGETPTQLPVKLMIGDVDVTSLLREQLIEALFSNEIAYQRYKANAAGDGSAEQATQINDVSDPRADLLPAILDQLQLGNVIAALTGSSTALELVGNHDVGEAAAYVREQIDAIINPTRG
ncbi:hypothetical protein [Nocardia sp. NPDC004711]